MTQPYDPLASIAEGTVKGLVGVLAGVFAQKGHPVLSTFAPPPPDEGFMGRDEEKETVVRGLLQNSAVLLCGPPGVGKSAIARAVAHEPDIQRHFGGRVLWLTAPEATLDDLCDSILRRADMGEALKDLKNAEEKASVVRGALTQAKVRVLFVLDQADNAPGAGEFGQQVTSSVLVTSQQRIGGLSCVEVQPFSRTKSERIMAEQLLGANAPRKLKRSEKQLLSTVARQCGYLPLALVLAGSQLHEGYTVQDLSNDLTERGLDPLVDPVDSTKSVRATLDLAYGRLDTRLQKLFACFGAFNLLEAPISREGVLSACGAGQPRDLALLAARSLVAGTGKDDRYTMHSLLWRYACEKLGDDPAPRARALDYFTKVAEKHDEERWQHYREMDAALPHLFSLLRWARERADQDVSLKGAVLLNVIAEFLDRRGYWEERVEWGQWALDIARAAGNKPLMARSAHHLAMAFHHRGVMTEARELYEESLALAREMGNKSGIAGTLHQLGILAQDQGDYEGARTLYGESLALAREMGNKGGIASTLHQLGWLAQVQGDYPTAHKLYEESLKTNRELGNKSGTAATLHSLGNLAYLQGDHAGARTRYEESLALAREMGDKGVIAGTLHNLGALAEAEGRTEEAADYFKQALAILEALHSPDAEMARKALARVAGAQGGSTGAPGTAKP